MSHLRLGGWLWPSLLSVAVPTFFERYNADPEGYAAFVK
jgi:hypothetical protein